MAMTASVAPVTYASMIGGLGRETWRQESRLGGGWSCGPEAQRVAGRRGLFLARLPQRRPGSERKQEGDPHRMHDLERGLRDVVDESDDEVGETQAPCGRAVDFQNVAIPRDDDEKQKRDTHP